MKHTICYIDHNKEAHDKWLGPSLANLKGDFDVLAIPSGKPPAEIYNDFLDQAKTDTLLTLHQDMEFSPTLLLDIEHTISLYPDYGTIGLAGALPGEPYTTAWANTTQVFTVSTFDPCLVLINRTHNVRFNHTTFKGFHFYMEDYCLRQARKHGRDNHTILLKHSTTYFHHASTATSKPNGTGWNKIDYAMQRDMLEFRHPGCKCI